MKIKNSESAYGLIAIIFHWLMAFLMIFLLALGLYMVRLPISMEKLRLYGWHKEFGVLVLFLVVLRIYWRLTNIKPRLDILVFEKIAATTAHFAFYVFMFAIPITGWLITSAAGLPVSFFGLFLLPSLVAPDNNVMQLFIEIHKWLGYALILTITLHFLAALKHHFINKDDILKRMLP